MPSSLEIDQHVVDQFNRLVEVRNHQPHALLGIHPFSYDKKVIRLWRPDAQQVFLELFGQIVEAHRTDQFGIFELVVPLSTTSLDYRVYHHNGLLAHDPYAFLSTFGELDQYLFAKGVHYQLYKQMGGRLVCHQGIEGAKFSVWAPNAKSVSVIADFNHWDGRVNPMRVMGYSGVWELFIPGLQEGEKYKFEIFTQQGERLIKADPYALMGEKRPATASVLAKLDRFEWNDEAWVQERQKNRFHSHPMTIYELHLGSWRRNNNEFLNYRELGHQLADYCLEMGFNTIELMPIQEHPLDESWGYQVSGFYATTSRFGTPEDFKYFVNHLHQQGIGVILDWVPGHFPMDQFSLGRFDGSALYEHSDPRQGYHPHWHTHIFNFGRNEVSNFLIANALFWFEEMHVDGLRVDAVASMLYLDYGREEGGWIPNQYGGKENLQAIEFIKHLNSIVHTHCPGVLMIAEESTSFTGVTHSVEHGGLGFDLKWNMGWMNDTLRYFGQDCFFRNYHHHHLTFGLIYAFSERFVLVLSHDEVVHGKKALLAKMPGDAWQQFANLRLLYSYMICQPGKKLLFMGGEIGQWNEWNCQREIEWDLLHYPNHRGLQQMIKELNHFYLKHRPLWEKDFHYETFQWVDFHDIKNSVISYFRKGGGERLLCIHNFTAAYLPNYFLSIGHFRSAEELFNTDDQKFGGSGKLNECPEIICDCYGYPTGLNLALAPLATMIFKITE